MLVPISIVFEILKPQVPSVQIWKHLHILVLFENQVVKQFSPICPDRLNISYPNMNDVCSMYLTYNC